MGQWDIEIWGQHTKKIKWKASCSKPIVKSKPRKPWTKAKLEKISWKDRVVEFENSGTKCPKYAIKKICWISVTVKAIVDKIVRKWKKEE